ncbi:MAG: lycopene cyclase [Saprospiraceae bacterium]|nr:lycopene cyclase [Saprospiraceae bacterium]
MKKYDYILTGGGASGLITAYRMSRDSFFADKSILIIEKDNKNSNDRTWCFWESSIGEWDELLTKKWHNIYFGSPDFKLHADIAPFHYKMLQSSSLYNFIQKQLSNHFNITVLKDSVTMINESEKSVFVSTSESEYECSYLLNSIPNFNPIQEKEAFPYLKQHFVGWFIQTKDNCFDPSEAVFMDFDIPQDGNTRFIYVLPFSENEALVEYTLFSAELLSYEEYEKGITSYLDSKGIKDYTITEKEVGNIPMTCYPFHQKNTKRILHIGSAGGWTKASTGFTFDFISKKSVSLIAFLKTEKPMNEFYKKSRFEFYDRIFIEVLYRDNALGSQVFSSLFKSVKPQLVLKFLNEESKFSDEFKVMYYTKPSLSFTVSAFTSFYKLIKHNFSK